MVITEYAVFGSAQERADLAIIYCETIGGIFVFSMP